MAARYHINPATGRPNVCTAQPGNCRFGSSEEEHYSNKEDARLAFEVKMRDAAIPAGVSARDAALASSYVVARSWQQLPEEPTEEDLNIALAYARVNNKFTPVAFQEKDNGKSKFGQMHTYDEWDDAEWRLMRHAIVATPEGDLYRVQSHAFIPGEDDDGHLVYSPEVHTKTVRMELQGGKLAESKDAPSHHYAEEDEREEHLRTHERNFSGWSYERWDGESTAKAATTLLTKTWEPYSAVRVSSMNNNRVSAKKINSGSYAGSPSARVRKMAAASEHLSVENRKKLALDSDMWVAMKIAERPDLTSSEFKAIMKHDYDEPGSQGKVIASGWQSPRGAAIMNRSLPPAIMESLARNGDLKDLQLLGRNQGLTENARKLAAARLTDLGVKVRGIN